MTSFLCLLCCLPLTQSDNANALRIAANKGNVTEVKRLLDAKVPVDAKNAYGRTPLSMAISGGQLEAAKVLLDAGADIEAKDKFYNFSPLMFAALSKKPLIIEELIKRKAKGSGQVLMMVGDRTDLLKAVLTDKNIPQPQLRRALAAARGQKNAEHIKLLEARVEPEKVKPAKEKSEKPGKKDMPAPPKLSPEQLKQYTGTFSGSAGELVFKVENDGLLLEVADQSMKLQPSGKDKFKLNDMVSATFKIKDGHAESLMWKTPARTTEFKRARKKENTTKETPNEKSDGFADYPFDSPHWPAFRGHMSRGVSAKGQNLPLEWNGKTGEGIAWKTPIPGLGLSSPIVWGDKIFVSTAVPIDDKPDEGSQLKTGLYGSVDSIADDREYTFKVMCLSLNSGKVLWERECNRAKPKVKRHAKSSHANPTPTTNGEYVVTSFGSEGLYCHTVKGELKWKKNLGFLDSGWFFDREFQWGFGASPYIFEDTVYFQADIQDESFLVAFDLSTGDEKWRTKREDIPTWSSPVVYKQPGGGLRVVLNGTREAAGYDATNGKQIWSLSGMSEIVVPTPQVTPGFVLLASGYAPIRPIIAVRHDASGELQVKDEEEKSGSEDTKDAFTWKLLKGGSYMPTPIIYDGYLFVVSNSGVIACHDAKTGKRLSRTRLRGGGLSCTGSPIAADGMLYVTSETGKTFVVPAGVGKKPTHTNELGESVLTTPAIAGGRLLIRGENTLFAIGKTDDEKK